MAVLAVGTARTGLGAATLVRETRPRAPCRASTRQRRQIQTVVDLPLLICLFFLCSTNFLTCDDSFCIVLFPI